MDEHDRSQPRRRVLFVSTLSTAAGPMKCNVRDVSVNGALLEVDKRLTEGVEASLTLPKIGIVQGEVKWVNHFRCGLLFSSMLDPFQLREMLEAKPKKATDEYVNVPRWERPKQVSGGEETLERSRGAVAWLRQQKLSAKAK